MEDLQYLFAAYTFIWVVLFAYVIRLQNRAQSLREELERLGKELGEDAPPASQ
jgi:CcmD family protein